MPFLTAVSGLLLILFSFMGMMLSMGPQAGGGFVIGFVVSVIGFGLLLLADRMDHSDTSASPFLVAASGVLLLLFAFMGVMTVMGPQAGLSFIVSIVAAMGGIGTMIAAEGMYKRDTVPVRVRADERRRS